MRSINRLSKLLCSALLLLCGLAGGCLPQPPAAPLQPAAASPRPAASRMAFTATVEPPTATPPVPTLTASPQPTPTFTVDPFPPFTFGVVSDIQGYAGEGEFDTPLYFRGTVEKIAGLAPDFLVAVGDIDPPETVEWTIERYLGPDFLWYPVVGNHEALRPEYMDWMRSFDYDPNGSQPPNLTRIGPPGCPQTNYSFDYSNAHFVALNLYCDELGDDRLDGDVSDAVYDWLVDDLGATRQKHIFVFGHEPAFPLPDVVNGRVRHYGDSLDQYPARRDRFWKLLAERGVRAYINGHTHNHSAIQIEGVWQLDAGHSRIMGDTGAPGAFLMIYVVGDVVAFETYRTTPDGSYILFSTGVLAGP